MINSNLIEWNDEYKTKLCIEHHLNECKRKFERYVDIKADLSVTAKGFNGNIAVDFQASQIQAQLEIDKELIDLWLLTESMISQRGLQSLVKDRMARFKEKAGGSDE